MSTSSSLHLSHTFHNLRFAFPTMTTTNSSATPLKRTRATTTSAGTTTLRRSSSASSFNDAATSDVILHLNSETEITELSLHSQILSRCNYFSTLLSDRWFSNPQNDDVIHLKLQLSQQQQPQTYITVLQLLYTNDFTAVITSASTALDILPVALELLFEDCVKACLKFLECVPWSEEEEERVVVLIPFLSEDESRELVERVLPVKEGLCEEMLNGLIQQAINNHPNMAFVKAFVAKLLREFTSREAVKGVLERAFEMSLKVVKESLEEYSSPDFRGDHNETEAIQRLNLHTAMTNGRHLLWLVERMIELRVADVAVKEWSEQASFTADLQRAFRDDAWRNIVPGLPAVVLRCTIKLANAVASGNILVDRQVRMKLVRDWLPVLVICKENVSPMLVNHKPLHLELEETFLKIISTLPMSDAQELLQQCLSFSTRNVDNCPHLVTAFNTWFRRASQSSLKNETFLGSIRRDGGICDPEILPWVKKFSDRYC